MIFIFFNQVSGVTFLFGMKSFICFCFEWPEMTQLILGFLWIKFGSTFCWWYLKSHDKSWIINLLLMLANKEIDDSLISNQQKVESPSGVQGKYQWIIRILTPLLFIAVLVINQVEGTTKNKQTSDKFHLWVTPPGMFFAIWAVIYTGVAITTIYNLIKNVWSLKSHFWFGMSNVLSIFWTVVFDHGELWTTVVASVIILCLALSVLLLWTELGRI